MKEEVISFETAKIAKEKKFPQDIFNTSWYNYFGKLNGRTDLNENGEYVCEGRYFQSAKEKANNKSEAYLAPRQSLLQKWLREKHNIHITIAYGELSNKYMGDINQVDKRILIDLECIYSSYEEALEAGLQEALKLI